MIGGIFFGTNAPQREDGRNVTNGSLTSLFTSMI
jgi:hypothetical protein